MEELPAGHGYADIVYLPRQGETVPALVIELKWNKDVQTAIDQIKAKHYPDSFKGYGREIILVGITYDKETKKHIGYSTGTVSWYPRKKIGDIVNVVRRFYDTWDDGAYRKYLALFGLDESKTPMELSEGMKVKFNLLIALSHKSEVLILDEPTSGLDPFSRNELLDVFLELKRHGVAVFFSTHIISDIEKCADDIVYISQGKIVAATSKDDFMEEFSAPGETLEDTMLRMEGEAIHA